MTAPGARKTRIKFLFMLVLAAAAAGPGCAPPSTAGGGTAARTAVITDIGSDTMVNLALAWAEAYAKVRTEVRISVTGGGSGTGISALINGTADIANASRKMKKEEFELAKGRGINAQELIVARDAIAVVINPSNPVKELTLAQLSDIFSGKINNWKQVGGENRPIVRLSREVNSGTHVYFLEAVVRRGKKGDRTMFATDTLLLPSSEGITMEVAQNPNAIGYDGLGYVTEAVKVVGVAGEHGEGFVLPSAASVQNKTYPISRDLYCYTGERLADGVKEYLAWILSPEAQKIVRDLGFVPVG